jgi:hypothetical protein
MWAAELVIGFHRAIALKALTLHAEASFDGGGPALTSDVQTRCHSIEAGLQIWEDVSNRPTQAVALAPTIGER